MYLTYGCVQNGPPARRVRAGLAEGGRISESIRSRSGSRRPVLNATLRAVAGWLFFRVAPKLILVIVVVPLLFAICCSLFTHEHDYRIHLPPLSSL
jgi:hypothetical protein